MQPELEIPAALLTMEAPQLQATYKFVSAMFQCLYPNQP